MLHSALLTCTALIASGIYASGLKLNGAWVLLMLIAGVALVGLPHGGLDHRVGTQLFKRRFGIEQKAIFYIAYLMLGAFVVAGWYLLPTFTVVGFFTLAAWHFGLEEESHLKSLRPLDHFGIAARGGMVIWCTALFQSREVASLLSTIIPTGSVGGSTILLIVTACAPVFLALLFLDTWRVSRKSKSPTTATLHLVRVVAFALMFAFCPVLLSFAVYFCGWHSVKGLSHLRSDFGGNNLALGKALLPMSLLSIGLFACGIGIYQNQLSLADSTIRTVFIGLSAVAIPHLLLHVLQDSMVVVDKNSVAAKSEIACQA